MKYLGVFLIILSLLFSYTSFTHSQVIDSDYVREGQIEKAGEVLGVETVDLEKAEQESDESLGMYDLIDVFAVLGGIVIIALVAYIVYMNKED